MADPLPDPEAALDRYRRTGDPRAFGALFDATAGELHRAALSMLSDAVAADDAVQQTYLSALRLLDRFETGRRVMPWLVGLLEGHVMHARRSAARRRVVAAVPPDAPAPLAEDALPDADAERTRTAIEALEEPYRSTALLRWRYGLEPAEIAHVRGEPPGTTRSILSRAVAQLRRALGVVPAFLAGALGASSLEGLEGIAGIRARVMSEAARTGASIAGAGAAAASIGGVLVGKKAILVGVAVLATIGAATWVWRGRDDTPSDVKPVDGPAELATAAGRLESAKPRDPSAKTAARPETVDPSRYHGRVVDGDGHPVRGARVIAFPSTVATGFAWTDAVASVPGALEMIVGDDGQFTGLSIRRAGSLSFLATAPGFAPALRPSARVDIGDLVLARFLRLIGRVVDTDGTPIAGAKIRRVSYVDAARDEATTVSDDDGAYAIPLAPMVGGVVATQQLEVKAPGFARLNWTPNAGEAVRDIVQDLVLTRGAIVRGRVFDADTKRGLPGVAVRFATIGGVDEAPRRDDRTRIEVESASRLIGETTSGFDGAFRFEGVPCEGLQTPYTAGTERGQVLGFVAAWVEGYAPAGDGIPVVAEGETIEVEIPLWPAATVIGRIVDAAGSPVANATVWPRVDGRTGYSGSAGALPRGAPVEWLKTGSDGRFESRAVRASAGEATAGSLVVYRALQGEGLGFGILERTTKAFTVRAGERIDVGDVVLPSSNAPRAQVRVVDAEGHPVAGALVRLSADPQAGDATTGDDGHCTLYWPTWNDKTLPETRGIVVTAAGFRRVAVPVDPKPPGADAMPVVAVTLAPERLLRGRVRWRDGSPAAGVLVLVGNAAFPLDEIFPARAELYSATYFQNVVTERGQRYLGYGTTDAEGRFEVGGLADASVHLCADAVDVLTRATLPGIGSDAELTLDAMPPAPQAPSLDLTVTDAATGKPVLLPRAALFASPTAGDLSAERATVGRLRFPSVPAGTYRITVSAAGYVAETRDGLVVPAGDRPVVAVALRRGLEVDVVVHVPPGVRTRDRLVGLSTGPFGVAERGRIDPDGRARVRGLQPGRYLLSVYPPQVASKASPILVPATGDGWVTVDATTSSLTVEVVAGGLVNVYVTDERLPETSPAAATSGDAKPDQPDGSSSGGPSLTLVDEDGQSIADVPVVARGLQKAISRAYRPGRYRLLYRGPDGRTTGHEVVVEPGGFAEPALFEVMRA